MLFHFHFVLFQYFCRSSVLQYGMWDQVRVDHGTEFYLVLYMQEKNQHLRRNCSRQPYLQTKSTRVSNVVF